MSTPRFGSLRGAILDVQTRPGDVRTARRLLAYAIAYFRGRTVASIAYQRLSPAGMPVSAAVEQCGFVSVPSALQLMVRHVGGTTAADGWWLSVGDTENSHGRWLP